MLVRYGRLLGSLFFRVMKPILPEVPSKALKGSGDWLWVIVDARSEGAATTNKAASNPRVIWRFMLVFSSPIHAEARPFRDHFSVLAFGFLPGARPRDGGGGFAGDSVCFKVAVLTSVAS